MEGPVPEERRVNGGPEVNIIAPVPVWALKRHHDYIEWTAVGGSRDLEVIVDLFAPLQLCEECTVGSHLARPEAGVKVSHIGPIVGGGDGMKSPAAHRTIQLLEVVARDQASHAECHDRELTIGAPFLINDLSELSSHEFESFASVHRP